MGPRHMTGTSLLGSRNAIDMTLSDGGTMIGMSILSASAMSCSSSIPNILGMLGPVMSISINPVEYPLIARDMARLDDTVLFPTPPLPLMTMMTCFIRANASWSLVSCSIASPVKTGPAILYLCTPIVCQRL